MPTNHIYGLIFILFIPISISELQLVGYGYGGIRRDTEGYGYGGILEGRPNPNPNPNPIPNHNYPRYNVRIIYNLKANLASDEKQTHIVTLFKSKQKITFYNSAFSALKPGLGLGYCWKLIILVPHLSFNFAQR